MMTMNADDFDMMNQMMETVSVIYENNVIIGWCTTCQEADDICDKLPHLQWGYKKKSKIPEATPYRVASVMVEENKNKK
jgi:hypothetical protein